MREVGGVRGERKEEEVNYSVLAYVANMSYITALHACNEDTCLMLANMMF